MRSIEPIKWTHQTKMPAINGRWFTCLDKLLSPELCSALIEKLDTGEKLEQIERGDLASYSRNMLVDADLAARLYDVIKPLLPKEILTKGCNSHFRFSKYKPGEEFKIHRDGINQDAYGHRAKFTVNIFLNANFEGGSTEFFDETGKSIFDARPAIGRGMVFDNQILHCGNKVTSGYKYLLRTDVMVADGL